MRRGLGLRGGWRGRRRVQRWEARGNGSYGTDKVRRDRRQPAARQRDGRKQPHSCGNLIFASAGGERSQLSVRTRLAIASTLGHPRLDTAARAVRGRAGRDTARSSSGEEHSPCATAQQESDPPGQDLLRAPGQGHVMQKILNMGSERQLPRFCSPNNGSDWAPGRAASARPSGCRCSPASRR
jgi:hypothetical protein